MRRSWLGTGALVLLLAAVSAASAEHDAGRRPALVYVKNGAVWISQVDGSQARRLSPGFAPRISPDGSRVAFLRAGTSGGTPSLHVIGTRPGATPRLLARGVDEIEWSPDSRRLAAAIGPRLAVLDPATKAQVTIDRVPRWFEVVLGFSFSPSGRELVWVRPTRTMGAVYTGDLFRAPVTGGPAKRLTSTGRGAQPVWGPETIVFGSFPPGTAGKPFDQPFQLWTVRPDGSGLRLLSSRRFLVPVAWSANGRRLLACYRAEFDCAPAAVDPRTGVVRDLFRPRAKSRESVVATALSRDGRSVLVTKGVFEVTQNVARIPYAGGPARVIVRNADSPDWNR